MTVPTEVDDLDQAISQFGKQIVAVEWTISVQKAQLKVASKKVEDAEDSVLDCIKRVRFLTDSDVVPLDEYNRARDLVEKAQRNEYSRHQELNALNGVIQSKERELSALQLLLEETQKKRSKWGMVVNFK